MTNNTEEDPMRPAPATSLRYTVSSNAGPKNEVIGCALGPNWHNSLNLCGVDKNQKKKISIEYQSEIESISNEKPEGLDETDGECWPVYVTMQNGKTIGCDFIVSATGVSPTIPILMVINTNRICRNTVITST